MARGNRSSTIHVADRRPQGRTLDFPFISSLLERRSREQSGLFWAEGARNFHAALEAERSIHSIVLCRHMLQGRENWRALLHQLRRGTPVIEVTREEFLSISTHAEPHGIGVVVEQRWEPLFELDPGPSDIWVVMDNVRTPGNLGTTLRTCSAVGAQGIMLIGGEADPHDSACIRASMGGIFHQRLIRTSAKALEGWKRRHACRVVGTSPSAARHYRCIDYRGPLLLLVGNERTGLRERQRTVCDELVRLPMAGSMDSLNLAVATAVVLYEAIEQRARQPVARRAGQTPMDKNRKATGELDRAQRSKELQTQGGTDLDTTDLDGPSGLERDRDDLVGENKPEWGPLTVVPAEKDLPAPMDPSGEDPFVPGTREAPPNFDAEELLSDREKHVRQVVHDQDPLGKKGPTYEVNQGTNERADGGSTDPNNDLTHDSSGLKEE